MFKLKSGKKNPKSITVRNKQQSSFQDSACQNLFRIMKYNPHKCLTRSGVGL